MTHPSVKSDYVISDYISPSDHLAPLQHLRIKASWSFTSAALSVISADADINAPRPNLSLQIIYNDPILLSLAFISQSHPFFVINSLSLPLLSLFNPLPPPSLNHCSSAGSHLPALIKYSRVRRMPLQHL